jgi:hypothetical protein
MARTTKLIAIVYRIRDRASSRLLFGEVKIPEIIAAPKARLREPAGTGTRAVSVRFKISSQMNVDSTDGRPGLTTAVTEGVLQVFLSLSLCLPIFSLSLSLHWYRPISTLRVDSNRRTPTRVNGRRDRGHAFGVPELSERPSRPDTQTGLCHHVSSHGLPRPRDSRG